MRVTNSMKVNEILYSLNRRMENLAKYQNQLSTNMRVSKPSDDPTGTHNILRYRSAISQNEQYQRNIDSAQSLLNFAETSIASLVDIVSKVRAYAVQASSDTATADDRAILASYVNDLLDETIALGNSQLMGKYIFSGTNINESPFLVTRDGEGDITAVTENTIGTDGILYREIGDGDLLQANISGRDLFMSSSDRDLFGTLIDFRDALRSNDDELIGDTIELLDSIEDEVLKNQTFMGSLQQRALLAETTREDKSIDLTDSLSQVQDIDFAEVVMNYSLEENAYQAALASSSGLLQSSLMDFLG